MGVWIPWYSNQCTISRKENICEVSVRIGHYDVIVTSLFWKYLYNLININAPSNFKINVSYPYNLPKNISRLIIYEKIRNLTINLEDCRWKNWNFGKIIYLKLREFIFVNGHLKNWILCNLFLRMEGIKNIKILYIMLFQWVDKVFCWNNY